MTVRLDSLRFRKLRLVNGTGSGRVAVELSGPAVTMECFDAEGIPCGVRRLEPGLQTVEVPASGLLRN
ncbi:hypothetical protein SDC9_180766 [bioreactor metagenome]|uniref:Uncharacterized protein n=1 Tax=bioreactor metagenome TaxID=1076179 RepID=A0A645H2M3_9ZZZZ